MKNIIYIILVLAFASCATEKKFVQYHDKNEKTEMKSARHCSEWYPVKEKLVKGQTIYTKGEDIIHPGDTQFLYVNCDSITKAEAKKGNKTVFVKVPVPGRVDTFRQTDTIIQENTARIKYLSDSIVVLQKQKTEAVADFKGARKTRNILWVVVGCVALFTIIRWYLKSQKIV